MVIGLSLRLVGKQKNTPHPIDYRLESFVGSCSSSLSGNSEVKNLLPSDRGSVQKRTGFLRTVAVWSLCHSSGFLKSGAVSLGQGAFPED